MSDFAAIESAVVAALAGLTEGGTPLFAEVGAGAQADRASRAAALARMRSPGALVTIDGRQRSGEFGAAAVRLYVTLAVRSLRSAQGARIGDVDSVGVFTAAERTTSALVGKYIGTRRLAASEERIVDADARHVVIEQTWLAETV